MSEHEARRSFRTVEKLRGEKILLHHGNPSVKFQVQKNGGPVWREGGRKSYSFSAHVGKRGKLPQRRVIKSKLWFTSMNLTRISATHRPATLSLSCCYCAKKPLSLCWTPDNHIPHWEPELQECQTLHKAAVVQDQRPEKVLSDRAASGSLGNHSTCIYEQKQVKPFLSLGKKKSCQPLVICVTERFLNHEGFIVHSCVS